MVELIQMSLWFFPYFLNGGYEVAKRVNTCKGVTADDEEER